MVVHFLSIKPVWLYCSVASKWMMSCGQLSKVVGFPFIGTEARVMCKVIPVMGYGCFLLVQHQSDSTAEC